MSNRTKGKEVALEAKKQNAKRLLNKEDARFLSELESMGLTASALYYALRYHRNTRGELMTLKKMHFLTDLYIGLSLDKLPYMVVEKSVQVGLSELFIIESHVEAGERGLTVMYILPKYELRNRFVNNRIFKLHQVIPRYAELVAESNSKIHRTSLMHFGKGTLVYVGSNVESEFIEIPVDSIFVDEKDRCNQSNLLMAPDRLTASPFKFQREISNPTVEGYGIDERYLESSQGVWMIKDENNGEWFEPDFFKHVVEEVDYNVFRVRDPEWEEGLPLRMIGPSGKPVRHLQGYKEPKDEPSEFLGEWVHRYPNRKWKGFRVSKLAARFTPLEELAMEWFKSVGNDRKMQLFYNSNLGLPYAAKGAKILDVDLNKCQRSYTYPIKMTVGARYRFMGVDVGEVLNVVLRERRVERGQIVYPLLLAVTVPSFTALAQLITEWIPRMVVIDAYPEIHKVMELKRDFPHVYSSRFQQNQLKMNVDRKARIISMDRTAILDFVKQGVELQRLTLPSGAQSIDHGQYYRQMTASTRVLIEHEVREDSHYEWVHTSPDHYFLAEAYCLQGAMMVPEQDVFDFFEDSNQKAPEYVIRRAVGDRDTPVEEKQRLAEMMNVDQESFLKELQRTTEKEQAVTPEVNVAAILDAADAEFRAEGKATLDNVCALTHEAEGDVVRVLLKNGYFRSHLNNVFTKRK